MLLRPVSLNHTPCKTAAAAEVFVAEKNCAFYVLAFERLPVVDDVYDYVFFIALCKITK